MRHNQVKPNGLRVLGRRPLILVGGQGDTVRVALCPVSPKLRRLQHDLGRIRLPLYGSARGVHVGEQRQVGGVVPTGRRYRIARPPKQRLLELPVAGQGEELGRGPLTGVPVTGAEVRAGLSDRRVDQVRVGLQPGPGVQSGLTQALGIERVIGGVGSGGPGHGRSKQPGACGSHPINQHLGLIRFGQNEAREVLCCHLVVNGSIQPLHLQHPVQLEPNLRQQVGAS